MSDNQNNTNNQNTNNTVKPAVHKLSLNRVQRPQTEGYEKDVDIKSLTNSSTSKPTLNLGALSYIPKSMGAPTTTNTNTTTENKPVANATATVQPVLSTNTPSYTPKIPFNANVAAQPTPGMPINQAYPMGQSNKIPFMFK